jgi:hypothetical protein
VGAAKEAIVLWLTKPHGHMHDPAALMIAAILDLSGTLGSIKKTVAKHPGN